MLVLCVGLGLVFGAVVSSAGLVALLSYGASRNVAVAVAERRAWRRVAATLVTFVVVVLAFAATRRS